MNMQEKPRNLKPQGLDESAIHKGKNWTIDEIANTLENQLKQKQKNNEEKEGEGQHN